MRVSVIFTTLLAAISVLALPLPLQDSEPSLSLRSDDELSILYIRTLTDAQKAAKAAKAATHKAAGLAIQQSKTPEQVKIDRQQRKKDRADKKAKITFAPGASKRLSDMGLHGNNLQAAQNFHKYIIKNEMNKKGLRDQNVAKATIVAPAHTGGTVKGEKNHITAHFHDSNSRDIPSTWVDKNTGETKVGEKNLHHVYVSDKLTPPKAWSNAVDAANNQKAAAEASKKAAKDKERVDNAAKKEAAGKEKAAKARMTKEGAAKLKEDKAARKARAAAINMAKNKNT